MSEPNIFVLQNTYNYEYNIYFYIYSFIFLFCLLYKNIYKHCEIAQKLTYIQVNLIKKKMLLL